MKANDLREMTEEELQQRCRETQQELFNLKLQQTTGQLEKPSRINQLRKDVARIKTILHERGKV